jgi:lipopolysaccharide/colanic/teichoic acid biosynthesis glycosyltransferase
MKRSSMILKCSLDIVGVIVGILVVPVMCIIALAIKLDSRGPIFFRQLRVGQHGRRFYILKFRTMVPEAEALKDSLRHRNEAQDGFFKIADDPRVTRIGRFLRCTSLDELPQLFNVLKREMSLVGPRPLIPEEDRVVGSRLRAKVRPGMTGPWQLLGPAKASLQEMGGIDNRYVAQWSLWVDITILAATVLHVVRRRGDINVSSISHTRKVTMMFRRTTTKTRQIVVVALTTAFLLAGIGGALAASGGVSSGGNAAQAQYSTTSTTTTSTPTPTPPPVVTPPPTPPVVHHPKPPVKPVTCKKHFVKSHHKCVRVKQKKRRTIKRHHAAVTG